ncbi:MAG TPA: flagellar filament capping protein FliD [Acidobacteriaceae bacterium]|nr:flagellar filament capping protein FliD [Acidobacteriaceae bacterium]
MGAVGISFGSPTSGQGFDVTQTVNEIVTNMQAVETPWKNQLTQLQAQDAAYTAIGTDLSALTTDLQSLTDFQGVLAQKQGSSSDTNILQLTSASNSAIAGSHTITVNSLASTASFSSDVIANASDLLSGTLTFTVGGTPTIVTIPGGGETLAQLSSQLNSAGLGVTTNVITEPGGSLLSIVSNTSGSAGNFTLSSSLTDTSNSNAAVNFSQGQTGADASLKIDGVNITSASNTVTNAIPGVTFQLLSASAGTQVQVEITNNNAAVETAVNSFVTDYNKVISDINTQEGKDASGNPEPLYGNPNLSMIQSQLQSALTFMTSGGITATAGTGSPASWVLNAPSANDTYTVAAGAFGTGSGGTGSSAAITTPSTLAQIAASLNVAGTGYSASLDPSGTILTVVAAASSPATLAATAPVLASAGGGSVNSITQLGISANNDGTLNFDSSALDSLLNTNYQDVVNFLQPGNGFTSFGANFTAALDNLGNAGPNGVVFLALQSDQANETSLNTDIANENATIATKQQQLTDELNQANYILTEIPQQLNYVNELYSSFTGYNVNPNGG